VTQYLLDRAWVEGAFHDNVVVEVTQGRFTRVDTDAPAVSRAHAVRVAGLTIPGMANAHSHAFHRALRGHTQRDRGTFWTWRRQMYSVAERLDPDSYYLLAKAVYQEMVSTGITAVGEFHYLHHQPDGTRYARPNAMGDALRAAGHEVGLRVVLLDACYLSSGFGAPPEGVQIRYSDGTAAAWADRAGDGPAAIHSVRAVPRDQMHVFRGRGPLHVHLSEQDAENEACLDRYGLTPTMLLHAEGLLGPQTTVVHATHLTDEDIETLGSTRTNVCITPTTERDLADGIGPARRLADAGCRLSLGSDSHAVVDMFEEMRGLELDERLATQQRGHWTAQELLEAATAHDVLGVADAGRIEVGARADLVTMDPASPRTAGTGQDEHTVVYAATASDVTQVIVDGQVRFTPDQASEVGRSLDVSLGVLWSAP
jgi:formiminoglutamate deiminase